MKKFISILLILAMVFTFAACGGESGSEEPQGGDAAETPEVIKIGFFAPVSAAAAAAPSYDSSLVDRIVNGVKSLLSAFHNVEEPATEETQTTNQPQTNMKKDYVSLNALLQIEGVEVTDGKVTLTADQIAAIENALTASKEAENALDEVSPKVKAMTGLQNKVAAVTLLLDNAPVAPVQVTRTPSKNSNEVTVEGGDPITEEVRNNYGRKDN